MNVTVFSGSDCAICHAEMQWMDKKGVKYNEIVVDESDENMAKLMEATGGAFQTTPFTVLEDGDMRETVSGFDRGKLQKLLGVS